MKPLVLICSEDPEFYLFFSHVLEVDGFASDLADGLEEAVRQVTEREPQAVILDCQPASAVGPAVCARLKNESQTGAMPVVALIAPGAGPQHLDLLKAGIDESFLRPFAPAKLIAYLRDELAMARLGFDSDERSRPLIWGDLEMRLASHQIRCCNGQRIHLSSIEFNLLRHLIENRGKVCSRDELIEAAWPANIHVEARTVDVHISRLRRAVGSVSAHNGIRTIRSAGYTLDEGDV
ncbi:response regulator transcription factor (plasmid) [Sinorhizobium numidicum]|uniref:Response regulator transcription factor n=1 Tax=Sinorhizobium numidicum TaxID=680248 RepID=A0ABY8D373_9HYPH|nr:response regulator transcription factor [Sinorhizobium numidicum]WEX79294.1 response regulator transcription factor [Sinorhizobium numidicum]WEX85335.1 response regulator transcription factor [Sinorhizobium numidicum]